LLLCLGLLVYTANTMAATIQVNTTDCGSEVSEGSDLRNSMLFM